MAAEEQTRVEAEEVARVAVEEQARLAAEEQARVAAEEQARVAVEEEARVAVEVNKKKADEFQLRLSDELLRHTDAIVSSMISSSFVSQSGGESEINNCLENSAIAVSSTEETTKAAAAAAAARDKSEFKPNASDRVVSADPPKSPPAPAPADAAHTCHESIFSYKLGLTAGVALVMGYFAVRFMNHSKR